MKERHAVEGVALFVSTDPVNYFRNAKTERVFPAETVVLNLETGTYHGLNPTAGRMLEVLRDTGDRAEAARVVAEEFGAAFDEVRADVDDLCTKLLDRGLLEIRSADG